jgi:DNA-binding NarL/FixJ family response regulator
VKTTNSIPVTSEDTLSSIARAIIVEDQRLFAEFLAEHCRDQRIAVLQCCTGYVEALAAIETHKPDIVLLDLSLPDGDGIELARKVLEMEGRTKVLAVSSHHDSWTMLQVQKIGIHGFVDKHDQRCEVLTEAIHAVLGGRCYYTPVVIAACTAIRRDPKSFIRVLSDYETRILSMIGAAQTDDEIAVVLGISPTTVQSRRRDIMHKLDIHSTPKLIHFAIVNGLTRVEQLRPG